MQRISSDAFAQPAAASPLADDDIHLWLLELDATTNHREVTAAAHRLLGTRLMHYAGVDRPPEIVRTERGKPYAPSLDGIDFNLSHARNHVLLAFARRQPLGVDIERIDRRIEIEDLARRFFSAAEADALEALPVPVRAAAFVRLWTCKEAVLKALGLGISFGLDKACFQLDAAGVPAGFEELAAIAGPPEDWRLALLEPAPGFLGALAWRGPPKRVQAFLADPDA
jgi:4'-phosphopantetheinyl transferase